MTQYSLMGISDGKAGTKQTLDIMARLARADSTSQRIRELALQIVRNVRERDLAGEAGALLKFVQSQIRYVRDVQGVETLAPPTDTLRLGQGDCDDKSTLFASLALSLGFNVKFLAIGETPEYYSHVLCAIKIGGLWIPAETIYPWPLGKFPKKAVMVLEKQV